MPYSNCIYACVCIFVYVAACICMHMNVYSYMCLPQSVYIQHHYIMHQPYLFNQSLNAGHLGCFWSFATTDSAVTVNPTDMSEHIPACLLDIAWPFCPQKIKSNPLVSFHIPSNMS